MIMIMMMMMSQYDTPSSSSQVDDQMKLLQNSWSEMLILDQIHQRMHNHLPDETTLPNGQKFELLSLALLGVPSMLDSFQEVTLKLTQLKFDSADYVCLKFILLLNPGENSQPSRRHQDWPHTAPLFADVRNLSNRRHVQECYEQVHQILLDYCVNCYPNVPVSQRDRQRDTHAARPRHNG